MSADIADASIITSAAAAATAAAAACWSQRPLIHLTGAIGAFGVAPTNRSDLTTELQYYGQGVNATRNKLPFRWVETICCCRGTLLRIPAALYSDNHGISISQSINLLLF